MNSILLWIVAGFISYHLAKGQAINNGIDLKGNILEQFVMIMVWPLVLILTFYWWASQFWD